MISVTKNDLPKAKETVPFKKDDVYDFLMKQPNFDLLNLLKEDKLIQIEKHFKRTPKGLRLNEFISIIFQHFEFDLSDPRLKELLCSKLIELFKEIDINDDSFLEWNEFSNHIISQSSVNQVANNKDTMPLFKQSTNVPKIKFSKNSETTIEKLLYYPKDNYLFLVEQDSPRFHWFSINEEVVNGKGFPNEWNCVCEYQAHKKEITSIELFNDPKDYSLTLATSSVDLSINFWNLEVKPRLKNTIFVPDIIQTMRFYQESPSSTPLLFTGGNDAVIHLYDLARFKEKSFLTCWNPFIKKDSLQRGHSGPISDLVAIKEHSMLASSGLDGRICLWDITKERFLKFMNSETKLKSVNSLEWVKDISALLSAGIDHEIHVYNTYVSEKIYSIKGHIDPIAQVKWLEGSYEVISADISGLVKIWDYRSWQCLQSFNLTPGLTSLQVGSTSKSKKRFFAGGKSIHSFLTDEPSNQIVTDDNPAIEVVFNREFKMLTTVHSNLVKLWSLSTGRLIATYRNLIPEDINAFCFDKRERKFFVAGNKTFLRIYNFKSGALIKDFPEKNSSFITRMAYFSDKHSPNSNHRQFLIAGFDNGAVKMIDDDLDGSFVKLICEIRALKSRVTRFYIFSNSQDMGKYLVATSENNTILIIKIEVCRLETVIYLERMVNVGLADMLCINNNFLMATDDGFLRLVGKMADKKYGILKELQVTREGFNQTLELVITAFAQLKGYFLVGNNFGEIWILDIEETMALLRSGTEENKKGVYLTQEGQGSAVSKEEVKRCVKCIIKNAHDEKVLKIEVIEEEGAFVTISFDCQAILWRMRRDFEECKNIKKAQFHNKFIYFDKEEVERIGLLRVSKESDWRFQMNESLAEHQKQQEVSHMLREIESNKFKCRQKEANRGLSKEEILRKAQSGLVFAKESMKAHNKYE
jgi:WD40 repeat protein